MENDDVDDEDDDVEDDTGENIQQGIQKIKVSSCSKNPCLFEQEWNNPLAMNPSAFRCVTEPDDAYNSRPQMYEYFQQNKNFPYDPNKVMSFQGNFDNLGNFPMGGYQVPYAPQNLASFSTQYNSNKYMMHNNISLNYKNRQNTWRFYTTEVLLLSHLH